MSLMLYTFPKNYWIHCKYRFEHHYKLEALPIKKYLTLSQAEIMYPVKGFFDRMVNSDTIHAFQVNGGEVYVHPTAFIKRVASSQKSRITKILRTSQSLPDLH